MGEGRFQAPKVGNAEGAARGGGERSNAAKAWRGDGGEGNNSKGAQSSPRGGGGLHSTYTGFSLQVKILSIALNQYAIDSHQLALLSGFQQHTCEL